MYTPADDYNGPDSFTFRAHDGDLYSDPATVSVTVAAVNDAPTADGQSQGTDEDTPLSGSVTGDDIENDPLTFAVVAQASHGTVVMQADGSYVYTPADDYNGPDSFTFRSHDGELYSDPATVSVTVAAVNDAPSFLAGGDLWVSREAGSQRLTGWASAIRDTRNGSRATCCRTSTRWSTRGSSTC